MKTFTTQATGIRLPIIHEGDNLAEIVVSCLLDYLQETNTKIEEHDIVGITEAVVARAQGNYASIQQISKDVKSKFPSGPIGVVFPILSRNRFSILLKGIALAAEKLYIQLSYPADEVGNQLISYEELYKSGINPYTDVFNEKEFREIFKDLKHSFTGIDYLDLYRNLGNNAEIILSNDPKEILNYSKNIIVADIHTRERTKALLDEGGAMNVYGLDDILNTSVDGSGFNPEYGLLGSNKANEDRVKLFPHSCDVFVDEIQRLLQEKTGVKVEVLIYGDGAFKDPKGKIWELADPVVSPGYTSGLIGLPNELKLKYLADNEFAGKRGEEAKSAIIDRLQNKAANLKGKEDTEGTTPRHLTDLIGSLCDLISGSGDKGTPVVYVKGYFNNFADE